MADCSFVAPTPHGTEEILAAELTALGAAGVTLAHGAVLFSGPLAVGYRACLWSRVASRVLLVLDRFPAPDPDACYHGVAAIRWLDHLGPGNTFAVECVGEAPWLRNTHFGELLAKDAIVDRVRAGTASRPSVDPRTPDLRLHLYVARGIATLSLDLAGEALHRRGISRFAGEAPLKENLAAAILLFAGWPEAAAGGAPLVDPMCGSGTLLLEAAWMARDVAPGIHRARWGFSCWRGHAEAVWEELMREARERRDAAAQRPLLLAGADASAPTLATARDNAVRAGLQDAIRWERRPLAEAAPPEGWPPGLLVTNPPYGHRLGDGSELEALYAELGDVLRRRFLGWTAWIFTGSASLARRIGLRPSRRIPLWNGSLDCRLLAVPISAAPVQRATGPGWRRAPGDL